MKNGVYSLSLLFFSLIGTGTQAQIRLSADKQRIEVKNYSFTPTFTILYNAVDPAMALKPAGIKKVEYNVLTWKVTDSTKADFQQKKINVSMAGDGFDDKILRSKSEWRTANIFHAGQSTTITANQLEQKGDTLFFHFPANANFELKAYLLINIKPFPVLRYTFSPLKAGYYSIGYTGAPSFSPEKAAAIWQPLIWQEKRIPDAAYLTPAFMATLPTTMVYDGKNTIGVMASPEHIPFQPLPMLPNSQFGISLVNEAKALQPSVYAPIPGGYLSSMKQGDQFSFSLQLVVTPQPINHAYQQIAQSIFGFKDYRRNDIASLNTALDNMVAYAMTDYAWFIDSLKGCAYSTDVPGAVKNVSSLNPLELALVRDDKTMFEQRAYPLMEFMLSREKFLFSLDSTQKVQSPSRKLKGPVAPLSELTALYNVFGRENTFYLLMMQKEFKNDRIRNLDVKEKGDNWINAMHLYKATGDKDYLQTAVTKANQYLKQRAHQPQTSFNDPFSGSFFFWPAFTDRWIELSQLYELTNDTAYLNAAVEGARNYTMFTWMVPAIPDSMITVNKGGKAPMYWYLKSKGHQQMYYPEEQAPAWRLSEIGLTPESSGTSTGHRAIFMANYAPCMLRLGYYAKDTFLVNVAKAAVIGRYRNFPGYHINTERTTAYEKVDFPLHKHKEQSVNSFHYNHILPMASMLLDYLVTDVFVRSKGKISFPAEYIEGYAYLQSKMYGVKKGTFNEEKDVQLWMPSHLLQIDNTELNYIAGRTNNKLLLAFTNQSNQPVTAKVTINKDLVNVQKNTFSITVPANGINTIVIPDTPVPNTFQQKILAVTNDKSKDYAKLETGHAQAMLFKLGSYDKRLYIYLEDDDTKWSKVSLHYNNTTVDDTTYPFEFTVPVKEAVTFYLSLYDKEGQVQKSEKVTLGNK
ncbi:hypothetical protein [Chitinophaga niabensis]|uniref:Uncharacterized protein n=1 Tax=Chitinophaga niabensis TaxID=536979 RepID=A0A1N6K5J5_9BACT|nr:hypothetical protein [Chitinophaga niabensis]SIO51576.1 hypothetical protein SAMN04488055_5077 [Chitinophaga niabensis]